MKQKKHLLQDKTPPGSSKSLSVQAECWDQTEINNVNAFIPSSVNALEMI